MMLPERGRRHIERWEADCTDEPGRNDNSVRHLTYSAKNAF